MYCKIQFRLYRNIQLSYIYAYGGLLLPVRAFMSLPLIRQRQIHEDTIICSLFKSYDILIDEDTRSFVKLSCWPLTFLYRPSSICRVFAPKCERLGHRNLPNYLWSLCCRVFAFGETCSNQ
jgi:hypothetical protein